jgi:transposase-like protein
MALSKYDPKFCDTCVELGKQGASQKMICSQIGINKGTLDAWRKKYPEFADAMDLALVHAQAYWETLMLANVENKAFNSRMVEIAVRGQFQDTYRETRDTKVDVKVDAQIDFKGAVDNLIKELKKEVDAG